MGENYGDCTELSVCTVMGCMRVMTICTNGFSQLKDKIFRFDALPTLHIFFSAWLPLLFYALVQYVPMYRGCPYSRVHAACGRQPTSMTREYNTKLTKYFLKCLSMVAPILYLFLSLDTKTYPHGQASLLRVYLTRPAV